MCEGTRANTVKRWYEIRVEFNPNSAYSLSVHSLLADCLDTPLNNWRLELWFRSGMYVVAVFQGPERTSSSSDLSAF